MSNSVCIVGYSTFTGLWCSLLPSVILMKPMTHLCWQCQRVSTAIQRSVNLCEEEKSAAVVATQEHLRIVKRLFCTVTCEECSRSVQAHFQTSPLASGHILPNSNSIRVHYSFDYAQQVCPIMIEKICLYVLFAGIKVNCTFKNKSKLPLPFTGLFSL